MADTLQVGVLRLQGSSSSPSSSTSWNTVTLDVLAQLHLAPEDHALLFGLLSDSKTGCAATYKSFKGDIAFRIHIQPSDGSDSRAASRHPRKRRLLLEQLFQRLDRGWDGVPSGPVLGHQAGDLMSVRDVYKLIDSPPDPTFIEEYNVGDGEVYDRFVDYDNPVGVRTTLHRYQMSRWAIADAQRSVARMLRMESQPGQLVDPSFSPMLEAGTERIYYVDQAHMDVRLAPQRFPLPRGGILCEQMGVGKTLMCLTLIVASRHQPTLPPPPAALNADPSRMSHVITEQALLHHPMVAEADLRSRIAATALEPSRAPVIAPSDIDLRSVPSLASLAADVVATHCPNAKREPWLAPAARDLLDRRRMYFVFPEPPVRPRARKTVPFKAVERVWLADTTLVIVPPILVHQWVAEIERHLEADAISLLVVPDDKRALPSLFDLMKHDIVLMSVARFSREGKTGPESGELNTVLTEARWKRIILDEGNTASSINSDAMRLAEQLGIERRWIVSGTPTRNLKQGTGHDATGTAPVDEVAWRKPTKADLDDLDRLGKMLRVFLNAELFQDESFSKLVTLPMKHDRGPQYGAVNRLRQIMSAVMVKHRPGIIEKEVHIPRSVVVTRKVHFNHWQRLTYNALTALVASNVYTSEGEDVDYLLHARNAVSLNQVLANLHLACLWLTSAEMDLAGALARTATYIDTHARRGTLSPIRAAGLDKALAHMRAALDTPGWVEWMRNGAISVPYLAEALPTSILDAWSDSPEHSSQLVDANSLRIIADLNEPGTTTNDIALVGWLERAARHPEHLVAMQRAETLWRKQQQLAAETAETSTEVLVPYEGTGSATLDETASAPSKLTVAAAGSEAAAVCKVMLKARQVRTTKSAVSGEDRRLEEAAANARQAALGRAGSCVPLPLPQNIASRSASAKINAVIGIILSAPPGDKFVLFATSPEIGHLNDAFALVGIKSTYAGALVSRAMRNKALLDFESPEIRVCMLELKVAARGVYVSGSDPELIHIDSCADGSTLTLANRMIFMSPIWNSDVQAQAIKRIHRIGQTRETLVEILVTHGTFEEDIAASETSHRSDAEEKRYSRALIENPRFVDDEQEDEELFPIRLAQPAYMADTLAIESELCSDPASPSARATPGASPDWDAGSASPADTSLHTPGTPLPTWQTRPFQQQESPTRKRGLEGVPHTKANKRARFAD